MLKIERVARIETKVIEKYGDWLEVISYASFVLIPF
jgi:hypothetical protein